MTLDGAERTLSTHDVMIKAGETPVALAGVMGGMDSEVTEKTTTVLLETAVFDRLNVRKTASKFNLRSESSARFEKGINLATIDEAGAAAAQIMAELGDGVVEPGVKEVNTLTVENKQVTVPLSAIENRIGIQITNDELQTIFDRLGFEVTIQDTDFTVSVPPRRWDIAIEAEVLEEIARIYGYDNIPVTLPTVPSTPGRLNSKQKLVRQTRAIAEGLGLNQVISYVLTSPKEAELLHGDQPFVKLALPMSEDRSVLRQSLFPALMEIAKYNQARQNKPLAFYEIGKVFYGQGDNVQPKEEERFGILVSGQNAVNAWYQEAANYDFYDLKGIIESYFEAIRLTNKITYQATQDYAVMHPGRTANILLDGEVIGFFGQVHPKVAKDHDLPDETFFAEINFDQVLAYDRPALVQTMITKYPSTSRDLALLVPKSIIQQELVDLINEKGGQYLRSVELFDRFVDAKIGEDNQSLAYHLTFQNPEKTLTDEKINAAMANITEALNQIDGLEIR